MNSFFSKVLRIGRTAVDRPGASPQCIKLNWYCHTCGRKGEVQFQAGALYGEVVRIVSLAHDANRYSCRPEVEVAAKPSSRCPWLDVHFVPNDGAQFITGSSGGSALAFDGGMIWVRHVQ